MQKILIGLGLVMLVVGLCWPWLAKMPIGRLPGDIWIDKPNVKIYVPLTSMILLSLLVSLLLWLFKK